MSLSVLVAYNDSISGRNLVEFLERCPFDRGRVQFILFHVLADLPAGRDLMGKKFMAGRRDKAEAELVQIKSRLIAHGYSDEQIAIEIKETKEEPVAQAIVERCREAGCQVVAIGRKRMSKAEEFVLGDPSTRLVRLLCGTAVLVVTV